MGSAELDECYKNICRSVHFDPSTVDVSKCMLCMLRRWQLGFGQVSDSECSDSALKDQKSGGFARSLHMYNVKNGDPGLKDNQVVGPGQMCQWHGKGPLQSRIN